MIIQEIFWTKPYGDQTTQSYRCNLCLILCHPIPILKKMVYYTINLSILYIIILFAYSYCCTVDIRNSFDQVFASLYLYDTEGYEQFVSTIRERFLQYDFQSNDSCNSDFHFARNLLATLQLFCTSNFIDFIISELIVDFSPKLSVSVTNSYINLLIEQIDTNRFGFT